MAGTAYNDESRQAQLYKFNGNEVLEGEGLPSTLNLMNFNARLYNPALGMFLAVDPQGQFASPYLAFGNNPVLLVDPDGELAWFVIPIIVGVVTGTINAVSNYEPGDSFWQVAGGFGVGFVGGAAATLAAVAITPAATAALGSGFLGGAAIGATGGAVSGFVLGGGNTWLGGGSFVQGLGNAFIGAGAGALIGAATGGTFSGVKSVIQGKNFWTGVVKPAPVPNVAKVSELRQIGDYGKVAPRKLPMHSNLIQGNSKMGLDHINLRHFEHAGAQNASRFSDDIGAKQLKNMIQNSLYDQTSMITRQGTSIVVETNVGRIIGTTQSGIPTSWIRTIFTSNGTVITSYPVPNPLSLLLK